MSKARTYSFVSRVPKDCTHNPREWHTLYEVENPNVVPHPEQTITRGTREWRNIMTVKGTERDLTGNYDVDPSFYALTRCDACDTARINRWNQAHWDRSPWERQARCVRVLAALECRSPLTREDVEEVLQIVQRYHLTRFDFKTIDESPGRYGYKIPFDDGEREWHWKLRQVRNGRNRLFAILEQNELDGYTDDYAVPPISLMVFNAE